MISIKDYLINIEAIAYIQFYSNSNDMISFQINFIGGKYSISIDIFKDDDRDMIELDKFLKIIGQKITDYTPHYRTKINE